LRIEVAPHEQGQALPDLGAAVSVGVHRVVHALSAGGRWLVIGCGALGMPGVPAGHAHMDVFGRVYGSSGGLLGPSAGEVILFASVAAMRSHSSRKSLRPRWRRQRTVTWVAPTMRAISVQGRP